MTIEKPSKKISDKVKMSPDPRIDKKHKEKAQQLNKDNEEFGGQDGADPTRYGDWEKGGRCTDF